MSEGTQMGNCGGCASCLAGAYTHGPYPHHFVRGADGNRVHKYGAGGGGGGGGGVFGGTGKGGSLSHYDYAGDHEYGEEPLSEEDAIARQGERGKEEHEEQKRKDRARAALVKRKVAVAERRLGRTLTDREVALVAHAEKDAERRQSALTTKQKKKLEDILGMQARHVQLKRQQEREVKRRSKERGEGLTERAYQAVKKDVEKQFEAEIREVLKQIKESKAELAKMLSP